jgi:formate/nitrite transporter FocA (FNT family)
MAVFEIDAYSPRQVAEQVQAVGVVKARLPPLAMLMLGISAGGFIALGALYSVIVFADPTLPFAVSRLLGGLAF